MNILITGTSKGIGYLLTQYYLQLGHHVFGCSRSASENTHEHYSHFCLDVADEKAVVKMFLEIQLQGGLDVLINNAGVASMNHVSTTPIESARGIFNVNVIGAFLMLREASKQMILKRQGRIVNMLSVATPLHLEGEVIYGASKAALEHITKTAAKEFAACNITINGLGCTPIKTDLIKSVPDEKMKRLLGLQSIQRYAEITDITNVIDFFIKEESDFITGQIIYLGGIV